MRADRRLFIAAYRSLIQPGVDTDSAPMRRMPLIICPYVPLEYVLIRFDIPLLSPSSRLMGFHITNVLDSI